MHFIKESFHRKVFNKSLEFASLICVVNFYVQPLESKALVYSRGGTAVLLGLSFIGFCSYLISQVVYSQPLLELSTENSKLEGVPVPDMLLCSRNSSITIVACRLRFANYNGYLYASSCQKEYFSKLPPGRREHHCYSFTSNKPLTMTSEVPYSHEELIKNRRDSLDSLVVYWKMDDVLNGTYTSPSVPSISLSLYDPKGSLDDRVSFYDYDYNILTYSRLGFNRVETIPALVNHTIDIYYHREKYRSVKKYRLSAIFGIKSNFDIILTYVTNTISTPLQLNPPAALINRELYDGIITLEHDGGGIDVKTEILQHTVLSSIALAGGGYSVLTGIYVLLFGMSKVSPWGLAHIIPMYIKRKQQSKNIDEENDDFINEELENGFNLKISKVSSINESLLTQIRSPRIVSERNIFPVSSSTPLDTDHYSNVSESTIKEASFMLPTHIDIDESNTVTKSALQNHECETSSQADVITENKDSKELIELRKETAMLATEMKELKIILSEYFIDTKYMNQLRFKKKPTSSSDDPELIFN